MVWTPMEVEGRKTWLGIPSLHEHFAWSSCGGERSCFGWWGESCGRESLSEGTPGLLNPLMTDCLLFWSSRSWWWVEALMGGRRSQAPFLLGFWLQWVSWSTGGDLMALASPELTPSLAATELCWVRAWGGLPPCLATPILSWRGAQQEGIVPSQEASEVVATGPVTTVDVFGMVLLVDEAGSSLTLPEVTRLSTPSSACKEKGWKISWDVLQLMKDMKERPKYFAGSIIW